MCLSLLVHLNPSLNAPPALADVEEFANKCDPQKPENLCLYGACRVPACPCPSCCRSTALPPFGFARTMLRLRHVPLIMLMLLDSVFARRQPGRHVDGGLAS